ncbi:SGNH/GDSL hydrolase family protein [Stackebrandtia soli]|uniref:SGNH/GDSL hydrolase family protein n=1 Tax=Stackebrandtia soli TaxID=1892856 RepID=UPI0039E8F271
MRRFGRFSAILSTLLALLTASVGYVLQPDDRSALPADGDAPDVRIFLLGDSITGSTGCWRARLWHELQDADYTNIDFVGKRSGPDACGDGFDNDHAGFSGSRATRLAASQRLPEWLDGDPADVVMMHLGSNDIRHDRDADEILAAYSVLVDQMRQHNPDIVILVAQPIPMTDTPMGKDCASCPDRLDRLVEGIPFWAAAQNTIASPVIVVDQADGFDAEVDTYDGLHSNEAGGAKIADHWYTALSGVLSRDAVTPADA